MNDYGIGAALRGVAEVYFRAARRTGRTTTLLENLQNGDRVVFATKKEASNFMRVAAGTVIIHPLVVDPSRPGSLQSHFSRCSTGRTFFDHGWLEEFYRYALEDSGRYLVRMTEEDSYHDAEPPQMPDPEDTMMRFGFG